jgi:TATA-binding protein-associated factor Taf7
MYKLDAEGFADYNELAGQQSQQQHTSTLKDDDSDYQEDSDSDYEEETDDDDDAASEISDNEEDEEYDAYNIRQQVRLLTKQLSALTAFVMKTFKDRKSNINFEDLAGSR